MDEFKNENEIGGQENNLPEEPQNTAETFNSQNGIEGNAQYTEPQPEFSDSESEPEYFDDTVNDEDFPADEFNTQPVNRVNPAASWDPVNYTPVMPYAQKSQTSKGLKIFSLILAVVIVISASCLGGYYLGKGSGGGYGYTKIDVDLDSKPADTDEYTVAQVYDMLNASIVGIRVYNQNGLAADASGVIYSEDGYVVTNDHIYSEIGAPQFRIYTYDGTEYDAEYVAGDSISDLAVLKIKGSGFKPATFGNSNEIVCGERVTAIGRPSDATADSSISQGCISAVSRRMSTTSNYSANLIQTDSAINPGSSGGALVNMYGQVIGITASKLAGVDYDAIGFAIPTVTMKRVVEQLISDGRVTDRAKLGITYTEINSVTAKLGKYSSTGLYVVSVGEDSDLYNKMGEGDIITHINGIEIKKDDTVLDIIENSKAGDSITVTVLHSKGGTKDYTAVLKANVGESSYSEKLNSADGSGSSESSDGTFDFPFGE